MIFTDERGERWRHVPYVVKQTGDSEWCAYHAETGFLQGRCRIDRETLVACMNTMTEPCP